MILISQESPIVQDFKEKNFQWSNFLSCKIQICYRKSPVILFRISQKRQVQCFTFPREIYSFILCCQLSCNATIKANHEQLLYMEKQLLWKLHIRIILSEVKGYSEKFRKIYLEHLRGSLFFNKSAGCWARTSLLCNIAR